MWSSSPFRTRPARPVRRPLSHRPRLEVLEDRCVPSTAGTLDTSFGSPNGYLVTSPGGDSWGSMAAIQPADGKIVVVGWAPGIAGKMKGHQSMAVLRYNPDGTLDSSFGSGGTVITSVGTYVSHA